MWALQKSLDVRNAKANAKKQPRTKEYSLNLMKGNTKTKRSNKKNYYEFAFEIY